MADVRNGSQFLLRGSLTIIRILLQVANDSGDVQKGWDRIRVGEPSRYRESANFIGTDAL
jgi:hypothetical protein